MKTLAIISLLAIAPTLGGCGALIAGAAGGVAANAVIEHERNLPPPPPPGYYRGW
jgi:hypothetical protein